MSEQKVGKVKQMKRVADYDATVRRLRAQGYKSHEIAKEIGLSKRAVQRYCQLNGIEVPDELKVQVINGRKSEQQVADDIKKISNGNLEYVRGYVRKEDPVTVRCLTCGTEYERTYHNIVHVGKADCPYCAERKRAERKEQAQAEKDRIEAEKEKAKHDKAVQVFIKRLKRIHKCAVCGELTILPKYCSKRCREKANGKRKDVVRRSRIGNRPMDTDITVEGLFRRDKGICYLCGGKCDFEDYTVRNGNFIAGDWYPSIDHVVPVAKGGEHLWKNVMLAHRRCNYLKSDRLQQSPAPKKI